MAQAGAGMSGRPVIGVTGPDKRFTQAWWMTQLCLRACGARAVYLTPDTGDYHRLLNGVIIGGGDDIDPGLYGQGDEGLAPIDPARDAFEIDIIEHALQTDLPIFGICRGMQLMNVVLGGDLYGDIRAMRVHTSNRRNFLPTKTAYLHRGSELNLTMGAPEVLINSLHHQAIDRLGDSLQVVARDDDNIVQSVESRDRRFLLGVQWHPEYLPYLPYQFRLFRRIVSEARKHHQEYLM
jgi:putative glutamine amidotransferase